MPNTSASNETHGSGALVPQSLDELGMLAQRLSASRLLPPELRTTADLAITILQGLELGLKPMQSIRAIHIVKGKPVLSADLIVALCLKADACEYFTLVESTNASATYETKRRESPRPNRLTYTIADAKAAKLTMKDNWINHPAPMLRARCKSALARDVYPDIVMGLFDASEMETELPTAAPTRLQRVRFPVADMPDRPGVEPIDDDLPEWAGGTSPNVEPEVQPDPEPEPDEPHDAA